MTPKDIVQVIYKVCMSVILIVKYFAVCVYFYHQDVSQPMLLKAAEHSVTLHLHKLSKDNKVDSTG